MPQGTASQSMWPAHLGPEKGVTVWRWLGWAQWTRRVPLSSCGLSSRPRKPGCSLWGPHLCCACKDGGQGGPCHVDSALESQSLWGGEPAGGLGPGALENW